jgi:protein-S-isoprenylcysteine O-methyltransferase Ste14
VQPIVAIFVLWMMWILSWLALAMGAKREPRRLSSLQNTAYCAAVFVGALLLCSFTPWPGLDVQYVLWPTLKSTLGWLMVVLAFAGFCLAWWARIRRGLHWAKVDARTEVFHIVETGPYKRVRQPIALGLAVAAFATAVVFGKPSSLCGALLLTIAFVVKALIEEHVLRGEMGAYDDYADRVPMLLPSFRSPVPQAEAIAVPSLLDPLPEPHPLPEPPPAAPDEDEIGSDLDVPEITDTPELLPAAAAILAAPVATVQLDLPLDDDSGLLEEAPKEDAPQPEASDAMSITKR